MNERVRAVLLVPDGAMLTIRRERPDTPTYWVLPGGGVDEGDRSVEDALIREIREEVGGAPPTIRGLIHTLDDGQTRQHVYLADIDSWDADARSGPELAEPARGRYVIDPIPFTVAGLAGLNLQPASLARYLVDRLRRVPAPDALVSRDRHE